MTMIDRVLTKLAGYNTDRWLREEQRLAANFKRTSMKTLLFYFSVNRIGAKTARLNHGLNLLQLLPLLFLSSPLRRVQLCCIHVSTPNLGLRKTAVPKSIFYKSRQKVKTLV